MSVRDLPWVLCIVLIGACTDSCGCGRDAGNGAKQAGKPSGSSPATSGNAGASVERDGPDASAAPLSDLVRQLKPLEDPEQRKQIEAASGNIDWQGRLEGKVEAATMLAALPKAIDRFVADGAARTGTLETELGSTALTAARSYKRGRATMNVKITDTADAPAMRHDLEQQLLSVGNVATGNQLGGVVRGVPGIRAYHKDGRASRAMAIAHGRFLIEIMVSNTDEPDDAWNAIGKLQLKELKVARAR